MERAIVIGGSLAGMCAARVLAGHAREVVVLDRDALPAHCEPRAGVPQSRHAHGLLGRGQRELDALFPGFSDALREAGALRFDAGLHFAARRKAGWQTPGANGVDSLWASRELIELTVRRLLRAHANVRVLAQSRVLGLCVREEAGVRRVGGVSVRGANHETWKLEGDLVIDASGRATRADEWLRALGVSPPLAECVDSHAGYASRIYQAPAQRPDWMWWKGLWLEPEAPHLPRGGVIFPLEQDRWMVTLGGIAGDFPPADEAGFNAFMQRVSSSALAKAVALATPLTDIASSRSFQNVRRHYEQWREGIAGFIALGDAACSFNPLYGQGMSVAAACATLLGEQLRDDLPTTPGFESRFFARQAAFLDGVWRLTTGADFAWPTTEGARPKRTPLVGTYVTLALRASHFDPAVRPRIIGVVHLTKPMRSLFRPDLIVRVLGTTLRRRLRGLYAIRAETPDLPPAPPGFEARPARGWRARIGPLFPRAQAAASE